MGGSLLLSQPPGFPPTSSDNILFFLRKLNQDNDGLATAIMSMISSSGHFGQMDKEDREGSIEKDEI